MNALTSANRWRLYFVKILRSGRRPRKEKTMKVLVTGATGTVGMEGNLLKRENHMNNSSETTNPTARKTSAPRRIPRPAIPRSADAFGVAPQPVPVELLRKAYELASLGPTSANSSPARFVFLTTPRSKATPSASSGSRQCRKDHGRSGHGHHRLGHGIPRESSQALSQFDMRSYFVGNRP